MRLKPDSPTPSPKERRNENLRTAGAVAGGLYAALCHPLVLVTVVSAAVLGGIVAAELRSRRKRAPALTLVATPPSPSEERESDALDDSAFMPDEHEVYLGAC